MLFQKDAIEAFLNKMKFIIADNNSKGISKFNTLDMNCKCQNEQCLLWSVYMTEADCPALMGV